MQRKIISLGKTYIFLTHSKGITQPFFILKLKLYELNGATDIIARTQVADMCGLQKVDILSKSN